MYVPSSSSSSGFPSLSDEASAFASESYKFRAHAIYIYIYMQHLCILEYLVADAFDVNQFHIIHIMHGDIVNIINIMHEDCYYVK